MVVLAYLARLESESAQEEARVKEVVRQAKVRQLGSDSNLVTKDFAFGLASASTDYPIAMEHVGVLLEGARGISIVCDWNLVF